MSAINSPALPAGFSLASTSPEFDFAGGDGFDAGSILGPAAGSDRIRSWTGMPAPYPPGGTTADPYNVQPGADQSNLGRLLNGFMSTLSGLLNQLSALLGGPAAGGGAAPNAAAPSGTAPGATAPGGTPAAADGETLFSQATAASVGDPHDSFSGQTSAGTSPAATWNSMQSHQNLLSSGSFAGGYRVSTAVTKPSDKGITYNERAAVTTQGGATSVTMERDGTYCVTSDGRQVTLEQGQATRLGGGETVTLEADKSLLIEDTNGRGGSISTTLKASGGGVDVTTSAHDVALGGYLVDQSDDDADPVAAAGSPAIRPSPVPSADPRQAYSLV